MTIKMLIDSTHEEETRVAIVHGNRVEEFEYESLAKKQIKGNIYLAKVTRVEPSLQAAFVEYGGNRHGFLAFSEIHPDYYQIPVSDREALIAEEAAAYAEILEKDEEHPETAGSESESNEPDTDDTSSDEENSSSDEENPDNTEDHPDDALDVTGDHSMDDEESEERLRIRVAKNLRRKYKIQEVIKKNQIILIQVVKEERGNKGAALTTYLSLPGRYCVLMPNSLHGGGVSRKIASVSERKSLKKILADFNMPGGMACIIRTAGQSRTRMEIKRDFDYLIRTWEGIRERTLKSVAPVIINEEGDLIKRSLRDLYTREIDEILVEGEGGYKTARSFMRLLMPSHARKIKHYTESVPLFHKYQVENQLDSMFSPNVKLKSGGYIVINPTEALVSIDVNSGKATREHNIEETARKTNLEAAEEVARQLRLRDMAGLVVIDFIDMEVRANNRAVEQKMKECLKSDRARIQVGRISSFGLLEMSRQRLRSGVLESSTRSCPHCEGSGVIRSVETQVLHILRALEDEAIQGRNSRMELHLPENTAIYLLNQKRAKLVALEEQYNFTVEIVIDKSLTESAYKLVLQNGGQKTAQKSSAPNTATESSGESPTGTTEERPRRRRRRSRNRNKTSNAPTANQNNPAEAQSDPLTPAQETPEPDESTPKKPEEKSEERPASKPRRNRSRRSTKKPETGQETVETPVVAEQSDNAEKETTDKKPLRRPYPPQARSRRKSEPEKVSGKASGKTSETTQNPAPAPEPVKEKAATALPSQPEPAVAPSEPEAPAKKKSGWWQRTFS